MTNYKNASSNEDFSFLFCSFCGQRQEGLRFRKWYAEDRALVETRFLWLSLPLAFSHFPRIHDAFSLPASSTTSFLPFFSCIKHESLLALANRGG